MSYEEAFQALNTGDYRRAVELLERMAVNCAYASDVINHSYTLALYRIGERIRLADVAFRVGNGLVESDPASAMDYFQRAIHAGLDPGRVRLIGEIFEEWCGERGVAKLAGPITRVGHVVGSLISGNPPTTYLKMLVSSLKAQGVESTIFTTESNACWFFNRPAAPLTESAAEDNVEGVVAVGSVEGDFLGRASRIAEMIRDSGIPLIFYHGNLSEQILARVAAFHPAPVQVNVDHDIEMDADLFDGFIHLSQNAFERTRYSMHPAAWIPPGSDLDLQPLANGSEMRESLGLDADTVSASFAGSVRDQSIEFVKALVSIMKRFPRHFHLFAGSFEVRSIRGLLHSEGVLPRVRFLGQTVDTTALTDAVDVYFAPFPDTGRTSILEMMDAGKPVVAMRYAANSEFNTAAELVGNSDLTPRNPAGYIQIADRLIRDSTSRSRLGQAMHERVRSEFRPERLGERYISFFEKLRGFTPY